MFAAMNMRDRLRFAPPERGNLFELPFHKHYVPRDEEPALKILSRKQEAGGLFHG